MALGQGEARVNSMPCQFLFDLFQIKFKSILDLVQTQCISIQTWEFD
jgi:hypothetical protein